MALWIVTGGVLGWLGYSVLAVNEARGTLASVIIGALGGVAGGKLLGPMLGATGGSGFSALSLVVAIVGATAFLVIGNMVSNCYNV